jgi:mRNA-degrading endonuclease toxin of MazEF toxin-antitoxin module
MTTLAIGDVIVVTLPLQVPSGHEQEGHRRAIVVGLPNKLGPLRHPVLLVVPFTSAKPHYTWAKANSNAYPYFSAGTAGLTKDRYALLDQVRAVDAVRVGRKIGTLSHSAYQPIAHGLRQACAL